MRDRTQTGLHTLLFVLASLGLGDLPAAVGAGISRDGEVPGFMEQPRRQILRPGDRLDLQVRLTDDEPAELQWYHNGEPIPGANAPHLAIESVTVGDAGKYFLSATNQFGTSYSEHARVSVRPWHSNKSVARQWMEELLDAIRLDYPAPTVHSRNLFSASVAMWDAWAAYDASGVSVAYVADEDPPVSDEASRVRAARDEAISYAVLGVLQARFRLSPNASISLPAFQTRMERLGYDPSIRSVDGNSAAAVGNRIAAKVLAFGWSDGSNEQDGYADQTGYEPSNPPMVFVLPGTEPSDPNRWQPLAFDYYVLQNGLVIGATVQEFLGPNWGWVRPFALERDNDAAIYSDPGPPPYLGGETDQLFKEAVLELVSISSCMDPSDGVVMDVSPGTRHNNTLGTNDGTGYVQNPFTGQPYPQNRVLRADYARILAEFWADGPDSETPPGHWNSVANYVSDHQLFDKRFEGTGAVLDDLEWDVKLYLALNGAVSDAAIACWDAKRKYDYVRPITMIRYMGGKGQSSDSGGPAYDPEGLPLEEGLIEVITTGSSAEGQRHAHLAEHIGEIAVYCWKGIPENRNTDVGGVGWIRAVEWMPYQRDTFVTPPFGAYTSGHSTFSRAGAEVLAAITGNPYFPGGLGTFTARAHEFLEFENGPEEDVTLTWATYFDAADEAGVSRLYGGIHVWPDDLNGRIMGSEIGEAAYAKARTYFTGEANTWDWSAAYDDWVAVMTDDPNQNPDPDFYTEDSDGHLAGFFLGDRPFSTPPGQTEAAVVIGTLSGQFGIEVSVRDSLVGYKPVLQISHDLRIWEVVPAEFTTLSEEAVEGGVKRLLLIDTRGGLPADARFLRVALEDPY